MSNELAKIDDLESKKELIKATVCKGATDDELQLFLHVCKRVGLDPLMKQIYSIKRGPQRTIQTGIDGFRLIAERTKCYAPGKEPSYAYKEGGKILSSTAYVKKRTEDGTWHEVSATAFFDEYAVFSNQIWKDKPHIMIAKCAECLALRKAFPANLSGIYSDDEMGRAGPVETIEVQSRPEPIEKLSTAELNALAYETEGVLGIGGDEELHNMLVVCLTEWQDSPKTTRPIREVVESVRRNKEDFLKIFESWKARRSREQEAERAKPVDQNLASA